MRLVYKDSGKEVKVGDVVPDFRGDLHKVDSFKKPHKSCASGFVMVRSQSQLFSEDSPHYFAPCEFNVGVINAHWIEREDRHWEDDPAAAPTELNPDKVWICDVR